MADDWTISVNIRAGSAPQVSIHADNAEEAYELLGSLQTAEFIERVNDITADYTASFNTTTGLGKNQVSQQGHATAGGPAREYDPQGRTCGKCGERLYLIEGEKNGRKWQAYGHDGKGFGHDRHFL